jgi:lactoylglutathione lyase
MAMNVDSKGDGNVKQVVPFFMVSSMERSVHYYVDGLGFTMKNKRVSQGKAALVLAGAGRRGVDASGAPPTPGHDSWVPAQKVGEGVSLCFQCEDASAIYHVVRSRGIEAEEPLVGNRMWVTELPDPDGYRLFFESVTDVPEETKLSEVKG